jgi:hypothetical protein
VPPLPEVCATRPHLAHRSLRWADAASAVRSRSGRIGISYIRTPVASCTALAIAAAIGIVDTSPSPTPPLVTCAKPVLVEVQVNVGNVADPGDPVVLQTGGQHQPGMRVHLALLVQRVPDPLDDRAACLRGGQLGHSKPARRYSTVDGEDTGAPEPGVHLHLGHGHRPGVPAPGVDMNREPRNPREEHT